MQQKSSPAIDSKIPHYLFVRQVKDRGCKESLLQLRKCNKWIIPLNTPNFFPFLDMAMFSPTTSKRGFTLIELLLVIGIIAILASIVIVAINPTKQLADARDAQRRSDVNTVLNAVYQYAIDNNGDLPTGIPTGAGNALEICQTDSSDCTGLLSLDVLTGTYVVALPVDPGGPDNEGTDYTIYQNADGRITVSAPEAENGAISVTR